MNLFNFPHSIDIWRAYLTQFVDRFQGTKVERAKFIRTVLRTSTAKVLQRVLFRILQSWRSNLVSPNVAMDIYDQALKKIKSPADKIEVLDIYVKRAMEFFGVGKVRSICEKIIDDDDDDDETKKNSLDDHSNKIVCVKYAELEASLGGNRPSESSIHSCTSQFSNPAQDGTFETQWNDFEVKNGNEDTFRDMLRVKRSVAASFSQMHFNMSVVEVPADALEPQSGGEGNKEGEEEDLMKQLEREELENRNAAPIAGFVKSHVVGGDRDDVPKNPEEIDLGFDDEEDDDKEVLKTSVPSGVYGSLLSADGGGKKREREDEE